MGRKIGLLAITSLLVIGVYFVSADVSELAVVTPPVTEVCLGCICHAISGCNITLTCSADVCGPFRITWPYWADSGKPTINQEDPRADGAFVNCVLDPYCAARAVQGYMAKFAQDCNGDGIINCYDHAAIHMRGGYGCTAPLPPHYSTKLNQCLEEVKSLQG